LKVPNEDSVQQHLEMEGKELIPVHEASNKGCMMGFDWYGVLYGGRKIL
jgi:hypothetical protein